MLLCAPEQIDFKLDEELQAILADGHFPILEYAIARSMNAADRNRFLQSSGLSVQGYQGIEQSLQRLLHL